MPKYSRRSQGHRSRLYRERRHTASTSNQSSSSSSSSLLLWSQHAEDDISIALSSYNSDDENLTPAAYSFNSNVSSAIHSPRNAFRAISPSQSDTSEPEAHNIQNENNFVPQQIPWWISLPYHSVRPIRHQWNRNCNHCHVSLLTTEITNICCLGGQKHINLLPPLPNPLQTVFDQPDFSHKSRQLNSLFSFSSIGVDGSFINFPNGVSSVVLQGRTYHRIIPANTLTSPLRWFLYDSNERLDAAIRQSLSPALISSILESLSTVNPFIHSLRRLAQTANANAILELNTTTAGNEIAAIIHTDNTTGIGPRSVSVHYYTDDQPTFVNSLNPLYESLQYPLFFPHGTPGWHPGHHLSQIWYYRLMYLQHARFTEAGRLANEYLVDMYSRVEEERLSFLRFNQPRPGTDEAVDAEGGPQLGQIYLPSSFLCGPRWQATQTADALAIVSRYGKPTFFITFTTNPNWPEIKSQLRAGTNQNFADIPFVVIRAFHQRLKKLKEFLRKKMGPLIYLIHVVEFQKRGLPHAHLAVKLSIEPTTPEEIDFVVQAEMPQTEGRLRTLVQTHMIHQHSTRCHSSAGCQYKYPQHLNPATYIDDRGYAKYRRRTEQDINIVPYNPHLLLLLESHTNVEMANSVNLIMYLYKYMYKGSDTTHVAVTVLGEDSADPLPVDEIKDYIKCRYLSAPEASWRILQYHMTEKDPSVKCLKVHLPENNAHFGNNDGLSPLQRYFLRPAYEPFLSMTYTQYYEKCTFSSVIGTEENVHLEVEHVGAQRRQVKFRQRGVVVSRLQMLYPSAGEVFYLRLLLAHRSASSFEDIRTVDDHLFLTFQEAAIAIGIFIDSQEGQLCMTEAQASFYSPFQLRILFCELILDGSPAVPLWNLFQDSMHEDLNEHFHNEELARNRALELICRYIEERGRHMSDFGLPEPILHTHEVQLELQRWNQNPQHQLQLSLEMHNSMNDRQKEIYELVLQKINANESLVLFIDGKAGRGKTFLIQAIIKAVRSYNRVAIPVGTTALAASNYDGGRTAHSLFRIPVEENSAMLLSNVQERSERWELLYESKLIIWDEFPMVNKAAFLCAENLMQNVMNRSSIFGGKIFIALGDFRQVAPVVRGGQRHSIILASVRTLPIWIDFQIKTLTSAVRDASDPEYSEFLDSIGDGTAGDIVNISILRSGTENEVIEFVYPEDVLANPVMCVNRSVLCSLNVNVDIMNAKILNMLPGECWTLYSSDSLQENSNEGTTGARMANPFASVDFLNMQNAPGIPHHVLELKVGCICNIMKNLSQEYALCKNTRVIVRQISRRYIQVEKVSASGQSLFLLPRMDFFFNVPYTPWKVHRKQFPLRLSYSNTFNSAQGLTLGTVN